MTIPKLGQGGFESPDENSTPEDRADQASEQALKKALGRELRPQDQQLAHSLSNYVLGGYTASTLQRGGVDTPPFNRADFGRLANETSSVLCKCGHGLAVHTKSCSAEDCECIEFFERRINVLKEPEK